ncbi:hypothetical protein A3780_04980 [Kosakonia radicincitans]|nr:hypothetical protein A3780_04980 [Kosakonia radicincitans]
MDIAQQQLLLPVPHVVIAVVIAAVATVMIVTLLTHHQALAVAEVMEAVAVDPAAARSHVGQNQGLPFLTQQPKYNHSRQFDKRLRNLPLSNLICVMSSFAMPGMTDKVLPKSYTICSKRQVSKYGSAKRILPLAFR